MIKKLLSLTISFSLLLFIYSRTNIDAIFKHLSNPNLISLVYFFLMFIPILILSIIRWHLIANTIYRISLFENAKFQLASKFWNIVIPSKFGEAIKVYYITKRKLARVNDAVDSVIAEKICDVLSLCFFLIFLTLIIGRYSRIVISINMMATLFIFLYSLLTIFKLFSLTNNSPFFLFIEKIPTGTRVFVKLTNSNKLFITILLSLFLWFFHLTQFLFLFKTVNSTLTWDNIYSLVPIVIFAGLLPFTIAGIGTRDAALLIVFNSLESQTILLAVGALSVLRYLIPPIIGLPFVYSMNQKMDNKQQ